MRLHRWALVVLSLAIALVSPLNVHAVDGITPTPLPDKDDAVLSFGTGSIPQGTVGEELKISIPLLNQGNSDATNVLVTPKPSVAADHFPFEITSTNYTVRVPGTIKPKGDREVSEAQVTVDLGTFTVRPGLVTGYYAMPLTIQYRTNGTNKIIERALYIHIDGVEEPEPSAPEPITVEVPKYIEVPSYSAGSDMGSFGGDIPVGSSGGSVTSGGSSTVPRIMLTGFRTDPETVNAGQEFTVTFTLQNMSSNVAATNIKASLASADSSLLPVDGAASVYIAQLGAGVATTQTLRFRALPTLEEMPYQLGMAIDYEAGGSPAQATETMSVVVVQPARVDVPRIQISPDNPEVGSEASVNLTINNRGRSQLFNAVVRLKDGSSFKGEEAFIGTIAAGTSSSADILVHSDTVGETTLTVQLVYEDSTGRSSTVEKSIDVNVTEDMSSAYEPTTTDDAPSPWLQLLKWLLLIAVIAAVIIIVVRNKRKKKAKRDEASQRSALDEPPLFPEETNNPQNGL